MKIDLENRIALVADGGTELGRVICEQLVKAGARVICVVATDKTASQNKSLFQDAGLDLDVVVANICDFEACAKIVDDVEAKLGSIDIVINNSDFDISGSFSESSHSEWLDSMSVNLDSVFNLCRLISEGMGERGFGRIINISSIYGRKGTSGKTIQAAAKSGVHGFTMALAQELARKGVTVNTVSPGHLKTDTAESLSEEDINRIISAIPAARLGEADEVASLVGFLCSNQAGFITGTDIPVNGGQYTY